MPFPRRLQKKTNDAQFKKFLDILHQLHINIPFVDALEQMPKYGKILKDILSNRKNFKEFETITLSQECTTTVTSVLAIKLKDPGSFPIPCSKGRVDVGKALYDLGVNINLMPLLVFKHLGVGAVLQKTVTL